MRFTFFPRRNPAAGPSAPGREGNPIGTTQPQRFNRFGEQMPRTGAEPHDTLGESDRVRPSPQGSGELPPFLVTSPRTYNQARLEARRPAPDPGAHPTSPRAPLESIHPQGNRVAREAVTTMPTARVAGRIGLTVASVPASGLNGAAMTGLMAALPPVEPISISLMAVSSFADAAAAIGAHGRGNKLRSVQENADQLRCDHPGGEHEHLRNEVLPYAINQQDKRKMRKGRSAIPFVGAVGESIRGVWMHFKKKKAGTLGVERQAASEDLARHLVPHHCELAESMVEALFGHDRMQAIRGMDPDDAAKAIGKRLKSN